MTPTPGHELELDDIVDQPAYERERESFRNRVIELEKPRRVSVGLFQSLVFENRDTIRFRIQEMTRAEKISSDEGILRELRAHNPLISRPGRLSATLFIDLTSDDQLREWLPKLVGIEESYELHLGAGHDVDIVACEVDAGDEANATGDDITATVHHIWWPMTTAQVRTLSDGPARVVCTHPNYLEVVELGDETRVSLAADLT